MNSCVLMAEIIQEPQLRYTSDNLAITEMLVQFPNSQRSEDAPATLKVVGWGNLATEIQQNYHQGDRVIIAGRLGMHTVERQEGFKEKRAELTVQQIQPLSGDFTSSPAPERTPSATETPPQPQPAPSNVPSYESPRPTATPVASTVNATPQVNTYEPVTQPSSYQPVAEPDPDDIPF
ncbi:single-stranded DNA-binding protein [Anabaena sp. UHCC 0399]|uniref:single-stranded DNA-binding protein n=1 Tax=Anabaena sp. UHCC 0399 TaxID=3110238 RepID=UPI002B205BCC|nr:single-stranded DNA-binding protein [Anabaena sp. UHCC 0399]MEA5564980.1 single-stranded DNA-binding protein [Anabaena sp. UHCC 0399]